VFGLLCLAQVAHGVGMRESSLDSLHMHRVAAELEGTGGLPSLPDLPEMPEGIDLGESDLDVASPPADESKETAESSIDALYMQLPEAPEAAEDMAGDDSEAVFAEQARMEKQAMLEIQEAEVSAQKHHNAKMKAKKHESMLQKVEESLVDRLRHAKGAHQQVVHKAQALRDRAASYAHAAKQLKERRDAAKRRADHMSHEVKVDESELSKAETQAKAFVTNTAKVAKKRIVHADEEADELVKQAKAKAEAMRRSARKEASKAVKDATHRATELEQDARSELVGAKHKKVQAIKAAAKAKEDFEEAESKAWGLMDENEAFKHELGQAEGTEREALRAVKNALRTKATFESANAELLQ